MITTTRYDPAEENVFTFYVDCIFWRVQRFRQRSRYLITQKIYHRDFIFLFKSHIIVYTNV